MSTVRIVALLSVLLFPVVAAPAHAAPEDGMGCPQGYATFDSQRGGGGPPSYLPGETVTASGYLTDAKANAAPNVTLRWGAPDGAAVGQAAIDAEGSWKGLSFAIPEGTAHQTYTLYLEARDANGEMLPGLPIPTQLRVGPPLATGTQGGRTPERTTRPETTVKPETTTRPKTTTQPETTARPKAIAQTKAIARPKATPDLETTPTPKATTPKPSESAEDAAGGPRARLAAEQAPDPRASSSAVRPRESAATSGVGEGHGTGGGSEAFATDPAATDHTIWASALAALLGVVALVGLYLRRRAVGVRAGSRAVDPSPDSASATTAAEAQAADLLIEAELQEMIAEHRAREAAEPAPFG